MELLEKRIQTEGHVLPGGVLKVDSFLNHQVDAQLMMEMGKELKLQLQKMETHGQKQI